MPSSWLSGVKLKSLMITWWSRFDAGGILRQSQRLMRTDTPGLGGKTVLFWPGPLKFQFRMLPELGGEKVWVQLWIQWWHHDLWFMIHDKLYHSNRNSWTSRCLRSRGTRECSRWCLVEWTYEFDTNLNVMNGDLKYWFKWFLHIPNDIRPEKISRLKIMVIFGHLDHLVRIVLNGIEWIT